MAFNSYMHERNIYRNQPDFTKIALDFPAFRQYAIPDAKGKKVRVDFTNPDALRMVTEILLKKDFNLDVEIPKGFLIPTVPQRLNYILWLEDLLTKVPDQNKVINGIDIGTGPCAIFSILGARKNSWNFVATENSEDAIHWAKKNIMKNNLDSKIKVVKVAPSTTLSEVLSSNEENYDFCLCNPPFFGDIEEIRKKNPNSDATIADLAKEKEIFFQGGEFNFVKNILNDSLIYKDRVCLFTSMCGKKKSFLQILKEIKDIKEAKVTTTEFCQGNTVRWGIAWTFNEAIDFDEVKRKLKPKKAKPPLEYQIPIKSSEDFNFQVLADQTKVFLKSLQIPYKVTKSSQYFVEFLMKSDENTWTHQRRKRREMQRQKHETNDLETESNATTKKETSDSISKDKEVIYGSDIISKNKVGLTVDTETPKINIYDTSSKNLLVLDTKSDCLNNISIPILQSQNVDDQNSVSKEDKSLEFEDNTMVIDITSKVIDQSSLNEENKLSFDCTDPIFVSENCQDIFRQRKRKCQSDKKSPVHKTLRLDTESRDTKSSNISDKPIKSEITCLEIGTVNTLQMNSQTNVTLLRPESSTFQNESISKQNDGSLLRDHVQEQSVIKMETDLNSIDETRNKFSMKNDFDCKQPTAVKNFRDETDSDSEKKVRDFQTQQGSILHCHLQFIKGKGKVYVKMNCPPSADRNTMYQVFQLIKNKIK